MADKIFTKVGDNLNFYLHKGQTAVMESQARVVLALFGKQAGKTSLAPVWLLNEISKNGAGDYLALAPTYSVFNKALLPKLQELFCDCLDYEFNDNKSTFTRVAYDEYTDTRETTRIVCAPIAAEGAVDSITAKAVIFDEAGMDSVTERTWQDLQARTAVNKARILLTTTPYNMGWLKTEIYDKWLAGDSKYDVINVRSCDNPAFGVEEYEALRATMPDWKFRMDYDGEFTRPAGLIYTEFNPSMRTVEITDDSMDFVSDGEGHIINDFSVPKHWRRTVGIDFGAVNGCALFLVEPPNMPGVFIVYDELIGGNDMYEKLLARQERIRCVGGAPAEDNLRFLWARKKCPVIRPLITDVEAGILNVGSLFKQNRIYIMESVTELREELSSYSRVIDAAGNPTDEILNKHKYHHLDALRYGLSFATPKRPTKAEVTTHEMTAREYEDSFFNKLNRGKYGYA